MVENWGWFKVEVGSFGKFCSGVCEESDVVVGVGGFFLCVYDEYIIDGQDCDLIYVFVFEGFCVFNEVWQMVYVVGWGEGIWNFEQNKGFVGCQIVDGYFVWFVGGYDFECCFWQVIFNFECYDSCFF